MNNNNDNLEIDILELDEKIKQNFSNEKSNLEDYKQKYKNISLSLESQQNSLRPRLKEILIENKKKLESYISDLTIDESYNFYILESATILEKYKEILNLPMKMNFLGKATNNNKEKKSLIEQYLKIATKYVDINFTFDKKEKIICKNCNNSKDFDIEENNIYICMYCSAQQYILKNVTSYRDIDRINISSKYTYDRKIHFRDAINQYQGKQNSSIPQKVYDDLEEQFELHHLLVGDKKTEKSVRFKNITKEHITIFLKELNYSKHYENINLIHYNITDTKPDDISHLEDKLLEDFDQLTEIYDKMYKNMLQRKSFINTQYILYQLLLRHKHPCKKEDFSILKTMDRQNFHDEITSELFTELGWSFHSVFF